VANVISIWPRGVLQATVVRQLRGANYQGLILGSWMKCSSAGATREASLEAIFAHKLPMRLEFIYDEGVKRRRRRRESVSYGESKFCLFFLFLIFCSLMEIGEAYVELV
jgi:hypothetical protein